ncbi:transglycosylase domain-containing protein [Nocardioides sp. LMS-CY]|uniref:transglycosylase domain-containing protein n=1 Tax=Nocardioides sp. (strain LMS-CY) TaxID=2840457 RepID=UPI001C0083ED|nr:transglycosylase domain-containing protein [Nocardioides sp. LMS-CY]QWF22391.1 transglycosylase domain-containing protein [Nocardioides sp. LMS-CY]
MSARLQSVVAHLAGMGIVSVVLGVLMAGLVLPMAAVTGLATREVAEKVDDLPRSLHVEPLPQRSRILDRHGAVLATVFEQNRVVVPLRRISRTAVKAVLAIEDHRFYQHGALDLRATLRALLNNAAAGGVVQGGSSISQQLVKQTLANQAGSPVERRAATEESFARKLRELTYAIGLEQEYSKDWILERYLNTVYFGDGTYGIEAAAEHYYGVDAKSLNLNQASTLAGLVQNPSAYDPTNHPARARARRDVVLDRMASLGAFSRNRAAQVKKRPLGLDPRPTPNGCVDSAAPFFCDYVLQYLYADQRLGPTREERIHLVRTGGLTIRATADLGWQRAADSAVAGRTDPTDRAIGALAITEPGTGEVRALAQSRPMGPDRSAGQTFLNYVVPAEYGDSAGFQAGSTFKAFVLAAAIEQGIALDTTFQTPNEAVFDQADYENCPGAPPFSGSFSVSNDAVPSSGRENLYTGTRRSINTFFLRLEQETGVCAPFELARRMGVRLTAPDGDGNTQPERVPIFPLGVANASPLEMAEAYATFAARGVHCSSRPVNTLQDSRGNTLLEYDPECERVLRAATADAVNDVLRGVLEPGGLVQAQALDQPAAGKTGNNEGLSVWFVGYTPQVSAAAMIAGANEEGTPILLDGTVVGGEPVYGASATAYAAPIWGDAMQVIDDGLDAVDFMPSSGVPGFGIETPYMPTTNDQDGVSPPRGSEPDPRSRRGDERSPGAEDGTESE